MPPKHSSSASAEVIVIGGGLIGCAIAFRLAQSRWHVLVLDRGEPGAEASQAAAGMLAPQGEMAEPSKFFELCAASRDLYPAFIADLEELTGQRVRYHRDGSLLVATDDEEGQKLAKVYEAQKAMGLPLEQLGARDVLDRVPVLSSHTRGGLFIPGDDWLDNEQLVLVLVNACKQLGVGFHSGTAVRALKVRNGRVESIESISSSGTPLTYSAAQFVLAAGCWSRELMAPLGIDLGMQPCRGQMIEFESPVGQFPLNLVVRSGEHYLVPRSPGRILAGTTVEYVGFEKAVTGEGLRSILEGVARFAPLGALRFRRAWSGLRPDTSDHLPILGQAELENLIFATGHFRNGILLAPITAQLISEVLLSGSVSRPIAAYSPLRFRSDAATHAQVRAYPGPDLPAGRLRN